MLVEIIERHKAACTSPRSASIFSCGLNGLSHIPQRMRTNHSCRQPPAPQTQTISFPAALRQSEAFGRESENMRTIDKRNLVIGVLGSLLAAGIVALISALSKLPPVSVPLWVVAACTGGPLVWYMLRLKANGKQVVEIDRTFSCETTVLENTRFIGCTFDRCSLEYSGGPVPQFERCAFILPTFRLLGPALNTAAVLKNIVGNPLFPSAFEEFFSHITNPNNPSAEQVVAPNGP